MQYQLVLINSYIQTTTNTIFILTLRQIEYYLLTFYNNFLLFSFFYAEFILALRSIRLMILS